MKYIQVAEITPVTDYGRARCPYNCVECEFFGGVIDDGSGGYEVECELEDDE